MITEIEAPDVATRQPVTWLNYRANVVPHIAEAIEKRKALGPNTIGEPLWPVTATYTPETGTRVGFSYLGPPEVRAALATVLAGARP